MAKSSNSTQGFNLSAAQIGSVRTVTDIVNSTQALSKNTINIAELVNKSTDLSDRYVNLDFNFVPEKIADPVYTKSNESFGVIEHTDPFLHQFIEARRGIEDLRLDGYGDANSPIKKIRDYIAAEYQKSNDRAYLDAFFGEYFNANNQFVDPFSEQIVHPGDAVVYSDNNGDAVSGLKENEKTALFSTGKVMRKDIKYTQGLRTALIRYRKDQQRKLETLKAKLLQTESEILPAHKALSLLHRKRLESASDYQVTKHLVAQNWEKVEADYAARARILNNHQGIYFARVRETALNASPPAPLALRFSSANDLVPGCPLEDKDLPEALETFMESVLDIPMSDWTALRDHYRLLPPRRRLDTMLLRRKARLDYRLTVADPRQNSFLSLRMSRLYVTNKTLVREMSRQPFVAAQSLAKYQWASAQLISLEDLLNGPPHRLRAYAENLRNKLDQASHCILQELRQIRPSIRLDWAESAEADTLVIDKPNQWPGLERAEKDDLNGVRTMIELVQWWFRQLSPQASSTAYSAVRNLLRACLLIAASDDPEEILHGQLQTLPSRFKVGDALRISLNREALPGTRLQLLDNNSRLVGTLTVEDHDDDGAVATLTQINDLGALPAGNFTVSGYTLPAYQR